MSSFGGLCFLFADIAVVEMSDAFRQPSLFYHLGVRESFSMANNIILYCDNNSDSLQSLKVPDLFTKYSSYRSSRDTSLSDIQSSARGLRLWKLVFPSPVVSQQLQWRCEVYLEFNVEIWWYTGRKTLVLSSELQFELPLRRLCY